MLLVHRFSDRVGNAGAHADRRGLFYAELSRDLVSGAEADAADVASQAIGIFRDALDGLGAIGLVGRAPRAMCRRRCCAKTA